MSGQRRALFKSVGRFFWIWAKSRAPDVTRTLWKKLIIMFYIDLTVCRYTVFFPPKKQNAFILLYSYGKQQFEPTILNIYLPLRRFANESERAYQLAQSFAYKNTLSNTYPIRSITFKRNMKGYGQKVFENHL